MTAKHTYFEIDDTPIVLVFEDLKKTVKNNAVVTFRHKKERSVDLCVTGSDIEELKEAFIGVDIHPGWVTLIRSKVITKPGHYFVPVGGQSDKGFYCQASLVRGKLSIIKSSDQSVFSLESGITRTQCTELSQEDIAESVILAKPLNSSVYEKQYMGQISIEEHQEVTHQQEAKAVVGGNFTPHLVSSLEDRRQQKESQEKTEKKSKRKSSSKPKNRKSTIIFIAIVLFGSAFIFSPKDITAAIESIMGSDILSGTSAPNEISLQELEALQRRYDEARARYIDAWPDDGIALLEMLKTIDIGIDPSTYDEMVPWGKEVHFALKLDVSDARLMRNVRRGINNDYIVTIRNPNGAKIND